MFVVVSVVLIAGLPKLAGPFCARYGLTARIIDRTQFSLLVTVVVLSAIVPTAIAQHRFSPDAEPDDAQNMSSSAARALVR